MKKIEVVAAIIRKNDLFLATQRGYGEFIGRWEFPGGKVKLGEDKKEALKREIDEEMSAIINVKDLVCTVQYKYPKFELLMHCYLAELEGDFLLNEHLAYRWLKIDELDSINWLEADLEVVENIKKKFK